MRNGVKKILMYSAKLSSKLAIKSCGAASIFDTYQPVRPNAVTKLANSKQNK